MTKGVRLGNIVLLRAFVILVLVFGHSMNIYYRPWGIFTPAVDSEFFHTLRNYTDTYLMQLFIFISGYLFFYNIQAKGKYPGFLDLFKDKALRLLVPYIVIALFYLVPIRYAVGYEGYVNDTFLNVLVLKIFLMLDAGSLWFLGMLFGVFIITWFIEKKTNISVFLKIGIYVVLYFGGLLIPPYLQISSALHYLIFFYLGGLGYRYRDRLEPNVPIACISLAVHLIGYLGHRYFSSLDALVFSGFSHVSLLLSSIGGVLFYFFLFSKLAGFTNNMTTAHFLDRNSYGIYLFHEPVIYIVLFYLGKQNMAPVLLVLTSFVLSLSIALAMTLILRRCGLGPVIGEYKNVNMQKN